MEARYAIHNRVFGANDPGLQAALEAVYQSPERPRCMCKRGGVEMCIAKYGQYLLRRMPDSAEQHHPSCESFEPEPGSSGRSELIGEAIIAHSANLVELRTNFTFTRTTGRAMPIAGEPDSGPPSGTKVPRKLLSLRGVLHYLFEDAGLSRWYPAMEGRRNSGVVHKYLMKSARGIQMKGTTLDQRLYVPEPAAPDQREEVARRRRDKLAILHSPADDLQMKMCMIVGELYATEPHHAGRKVLVKHMLDAPLMIDAKAWVKVERAYANYLDAQTDDVPSKPRLMIAAMVYAKREHRYQIDNMTLMLTTSNWIPVCESVEIDLVDTLVREKRTFIKPLQYECKTAAQYANALLLDAGDSPVPLHIQSPYADEQTRGIKDKLIAAGGGAYWVWATDKRMPSLPEMATSRRDVHVAPRKGQANAGLVDVEDDAAESRTT